jgi:hypothetical protein
MQIRQGMVFAADFFQCVNPRLVGPRLPIGKVVSHLIPANFLDDSGDFSFHTDIVNQENKKRLPNQESAQDSSVLICRHGQVHLPIEQDASLAFLSFRAWLLIIS